MAFWKHDCDDWKGIAERLKLPEDVIAALDDLKPVELEVWEQLEDLSDGNIDFEALLEDLRQALGRDPHRYKMLRCMLHTAWNTRKHYEERHIPDSIFWDTMGCFRRFLEECRVRTGAPDWDRDWWVWRQLSLSLFRLGSLEYEYRDEDDVIAIYIPSDADLSPAAVDSSLETAMEFWPAHFDLNPDELPYVCRSWLLAPALEDMLDVGSNIRSFRKRFRFTGERHEAVESCLEWLFRVPPDTPYERLPEETSLQRKARAHLLAGGSIGTGSGVLIGTEGDWEDWTWV